MARLITLILIGVLMAGNASAKDIIARALAIDPVKAEETRPYSPSESLELEAMLRRGIISRDRFFEILKPRTPPEITQKHLDDWADDVEKNPLAKDAPMPSQSGWVIPKR